MRHIVLIGFMASGKTAVGRRMAARLGWEFLDMDALIEQREGRAISEIFAADGEAEFRRIESDIVASLRPEAPTVVATGGGTFVDERNRDALSKLGVVVCLMISIDTVLDRVRRNDKRPLAAGADGEERVRNLYEQRMPVYRTADVLVETDGLSIDQSVSRVLAMVQPRLDADQAASAKARRGRARGADR